MHSILDVCSLVDARASPIESLSCSRTPPWVSPRLTGRRRPMAEMCSCLMSKWLVSLFASEIVKLDIKFYERVPGPSSRPPLERSAFCMLSSVDDGVDIGGGSCCCCCHTNLCWACIWSRRKF